MKFDQQWHGYKRGHQLLGTTTELDARDQDLIDKLSDATGSPRPGELFDPYVTVYPLPSGLFHVVARTWQDREAPRSGAVFTRSLLVPTADWRSLRSLRPLFELLADRHPPDGPVQLTPKSDPWPAVTDPNVASLIEAMFLEQAAGIACFGFSEKELIVGRLLEALWPDRRATTAVCTYALGPRSLPDRDFDLVFAPESVRSRFAKWTGRKVVASSAGEERHPWTAQIARRVFCDPEPSLADLDEIGALEAGARGDSSSLRLALLWGDLKQKAAASPTSLLGMLDILTSLGRSPWSVQQFAPILIRVLSQLTDSKPDDAWRFIQLLIRKLGDDVPLHVIRLIFAATREIVRSAPRIIMAPATGESGVYVPHLLRPAVARGLADLVPTALEPILFALPPGV